MPSSCDFSSKWRQSSRHSLMWFWKFNLIIYYSVPFRLKPTLTVQRRSWQIIRININIHISKRLHPLHINFWYMLLVISINMIISLWFNLNMIIQRSIIPLLLPTSITADNQILHYLSVIIGHWTCVLILVIDSFCIQLKLFFFFFSFRRKLHGCVS